MLKAIIKPSNALIIITVLLWSAAAFAVSPATVTKGLQSASQETSILSRYINQELTPKVISIALLTAFFLGAVHALSPGHGKAMVASYLIGSRGKITDAILLGGIVTLTHIISVVILGVCSLVLAEHLVQERVYGWLGLFSGLLIFLIGYWMLAKPALTMADIRHREQHHGHHHHHNEPTHDHDHHNHSHNPDDHITLKSLFTLGTAGGMVPCPTATVVLLAAIAIHKTLFGLLIIAFFSLGLAVVLILIGIMTIKASTYVELFSEDKKLIRRLPVFSAGIIMLIGISVSFNALLSAGIITFGI